jgi:hypothetical protein
MEFVVPLLETFVTQAAEAAKVATITLSFGDAVSGAVGGGVPLTAVLTYLGLKKYKNSKNGTANWREVFKYSLENISDELKAGRQLAEQQLELQKKQLDWMMNSEISDARVEDRLKLLREEIRDIHTDLRQR